MYNESLEMIKMLVRHGNSFALILDKPVLELLNVDPARPVAVSTADGKSLLIAPLSGLRKEPQSERVRDNVREGKQENKEAYDESNIDPVDRCAGSDQHGLFKH
jgi:antitoxin component of MazEF toxin-antitoxin module